MPPPAIPNIGSPTTRTPPGIPAAQLNSFNKPEQFAKPTAYRSAAKFLNEYKFFIHAMHPTDPVMQATCLYGHLKGRAAQWYYSTVMNRPLMYERDAMYAAFLTRFGAADPESLVKGYRNRRQKKDESVETYMADMVDLLSNSDLDEKTQIDYLLNGLRPEIGNVIRFDAPDSINKVELLAMKQESSLKALKDDSKTPTAELCELNPIPETAGVVQLEGAAVVTCPGPTTSQTGGGTRERTGYLDPATKGILKADSGTGLTPSAPERDTVMATGETDPTLEVERSTGVTVDLGLDLQGRDSDRYTDRGRSRDRDDRRGYDANRSGSGYRGQWRSDRSLSRGRDGYRYATMSQPRIRLWILWQI